MQGDQEGDFAPPLGPAVARFEAASIAEKVFDEESDVL